MRARALAKLRPRVEGTHTVIAAEKALTNDGGRDGHRRSAWHGAAQALAQVKMAPSARIEGGDETGVQGR